MANDWVRTSWLITLRVREREEARTQSPGSLVTAVSEAESPGEGTDLRER